MDNLFEQMAQITKAHGYDILAERVKEQDIEIARLQSENSQLEIQLRGAQERVRALQEFINEVRPKDAVSVELGRTDPDDIKDVL